MCLPGMHSWHSRTWNARSGHVQPYADASAVLACTSAGYLDLAVALLADALGVMMLLLCSACLLQAMQLLICAIGTQCCS